VACQRFRTRLSAYLDGELQVPQRDAVRRHVDTCGNCSLELRRLERLTGYLQEIQAPEVPAALTRRIFIDASRLVFATRRPWWARVRLMPIRPAGGLWLTRAAVCALFLLGIATGSYLGWEAGRSPRPLASPLEGTNAGAVYGLDVFDGAPTGSVEGAYAALALPAEDSSR
jgi:anti-sigma factor RsiW